MARFGRPAAQTRSRLLIALALALGLALMPSRPAAAQSTDLTQLSLEDLMNTEITSASRKPQTLARTAAAVYIITREDIQRSGSKSIPDLLRMVPGVSVAQVDASSWAVSARGFTGLYSNKLLVMVDGRSVYSSTFGGVHWDMLNVPLGDIDRIEVIRGPGGTLWGTNAVNGVVNIITKPPDATQGTQVIVRAGTPNHRAGEVRYGGPLNARASYRVFAGYSGHGSDAVLEGFINPDDASVGIGGARVDWRGEIDTVAVQGSLQHGTGDHVWNLYTLSPPYSALSSFPSQFTDGNVSASWTRSTSSRSESELQAYYQQYSRTEQDVLEHERAASVEARHRRTIGRQDLVMGLGYRFASQAIVNTPRVQFVPADEHQHLFSGFLQDEIEITRTFLLTPGAKFERNPYTGVEFQPSLRAAWMPSRQHSLWTAVTRAVRTPTRFERGLQSIRNVSAGPGGIPVVAQVLGNPDMASEDLRALEAGYRWQQGTASLDVTGYRAAYSGLRGTQAGVPALGVIAGQAALVVPVRFGNLLNADTRGIGMAAQWQPAAWWKMAGSYAWLGVHAERTDGAGGLVGTEGLVPAHQFHIRSYFELPGNTEASGLFYRVAGIDAQQLAAYRKLDLRFAWRARPSLELAVVAQNLLHQGDREFGDTSAPLPTPIRTAAFAEIAWRF